jgi:hypothetical protein
MTKQITLQQALELVDFDQNSYGTWRVSVVKGGCDTVEDYCGIVKGECGTVKGNCGTVEGDCGVVKGYCGVVKGDCHTVKGDCSFVKGDCHTVEGRLLGTINGRQWQYIETPREKIVRLIEEGASKEELLKALEELPND